jgi:hypothetical protein
MYTQEALMLQVEAESAIETRNLDIIRPWAYTYPQPQKGNRSLSVDRERQ